MLTKIILISILFYNIDNIIVFYTSDKILFCLNGFVIR